MSHYVNVCKHDIVMGQCRCPGTPGSPKSKRLVECDHPEPDVYVAQTFDVPVEMLQGDTRLAAIRGLVATGEGLTHSAALYLLQQYDAERERATKVVALHQPYKGEHGGTYCSHCQTSPGVSATGIDWPCATAKALGLT